MILIEENFTEIDILKKKKQTKVIMN